jgi:DNA-binding response OmpR family regulator
MMTKSGVEVCATNTSAETLKLARSGAFDLYLLDGDFPDGNGLELCRRIREFDSETPIVFFSGTASESHKQKALNAGANDYIVKPDFERRLPGTLLALIGIGPRANAAGEKQR